MKTISSAILMLLALPVYVAAASETAVDEITVTVKRRAANVSDVSSAVTIIPRSSVEPQKIITDALLDQVGTFLQQTTPGQGAAIVRGLYGSSVLHLVDNIRLNNAIFRSAPTQYLALVPPAAVERLEVLRGTSASLYGSDAVGGAIEVVTRIPKFDTEQMNYRGSMMLALDTAELGKKVSATFDTGNRYIASSLSADYQRSGDRRTGSGERVGPSGYESQALRFVLSATPDESKSWLLDLHYLEQPETPRVDELVAGFGQATPSSSEFVFAPNQRLFARASHTNSAGLFGLDWSVDLAWQRIVDDRISREFGSRERRFEENSSDLYAATFSAAGGTDIIDWIAGAEIYFDRVRSSRSSVDIDTLQSQVLTPRFPDSSTIRQAAIYFNLDRHIGDRHLVSAGVRFSDVRAELPFTSVSPAAEFSVSDSSGDLGWVYELTETSQLVANAGFGFRAPNIFDLGALGNRPGNRFNIPNTALDSERVVQGDFGIRIGKDRWQGELLLFALEYKDRITSVLTGDVTPDGRDIVQSANATRSSIRGFEARMEYLMADAFSATLVLNFTRGEQRVPGSQEEPADRTPPLNGKLEFTYDPGRSWRFDSWLRFAGDQSRLSARDIRDVRINPDGTPGWGIVGIRAVRETGSAWQLTLLADNLLDRQFRMHGSGLDGIGRNLSVTIRRSWL